MGQILHGSATYYYPAGDLHGKSAGGGHARDPGSNTAIVRFERGAEPGVGHKRTHREPLSNLVFEGCWSCGDLVGFGFNSVFERNACDDFGEVFKAA